MKQSIAVPEKKETTYSNTPQEIKYKVVIAKPWQEIRETLEKTNHFCPCKVERIEDNRCMCLEFRSQKKQGTCSCGLYKKVLRTPQEIEQFLKDPVFEKLSKGRKPKSKPEDEENEESLIEEEVDD